MTDRNLAYQNDSGTMLDDDPLAELARIVAGESEPVRAKPHSMANSSSQIQDTADFDIEAELMRELGEAEPGNIAHGAAPQEKDFAQQMPSRSQATPVPSQSFQEEELSLEDQLMAELSNEDYAEYQAATDVSAPEEFETPAEVEFKQPTVSDPIEQVESVVAGLNAEYQPAGNSTDMDAADPLSNQGDHISNDDELDDFFAEGFSDLLEEETAEVSKPRTLATPQIAVKQPAQAPEMDDLEAQFSDAFANELGLNDPVNDQPAIEPDLEADFAKAFEEQMHEQGIVTHSENIRGQAAAHAPLQNSTRHIEPSLDESAFADLEEEGLAAAPLAPNPSRNGFKLAVGALCAALVVGLGVVGWGAMNGGSTAGGDAPVIVKADTDPIRVKPDEPGGKKIENQDNQVYTKVAGNQGEEKVQEELISSREQVSIDSKATNRLAPKEEPAQQQATLGISPKKVRTLTVKPDGTIVQSEPEPAVIAPVASAPAAETSTTASLDTQTPSIDGASSTGAIAIPTPSPLPAPTQEVVEVAEAPKPQPVVNTAPKPVAAAPEAPAAADPNAPTQIANLDQAPAPTPKVSSSEWKVQVSSQRSREAAEASFNNIQNRFGSVLAGRSANIERADVDGKGTFYRVKILAESKASAGDICSRLKSAGGSCFVTR